MLILRRKAGEAISIGDEIRIIITEVKGNQVKIGVEAPIGVSIYRDELLAKIKAENQKAAQSSPGLFQTDLLKKMMENIQQKKSEQNVSIERNENDDNGN